MADDAGILFRRLDHLTGQVKAAKERDQAHSTTESQRLLKLWQGKFNACWAEVESAGLLAEYGAWRQLDSGS